MPTIRISILKRKSKTNEGACIISNEESETLQFEFKEGETLGTILKRNKQGRLLKTGMLCLANGKQNVSRNYIPSDGDHFEQYFPFFF